MFRSWWLRTKGSASEKRDGRSFRTLSRFGAKQNGRSQARRSKLDWSHLCMVFDRCSMAVQKAFSSISAIANEATNILGIFCKILDSVTLSMHAIQWNARHNMGNPRKVVHLVDMERSWIAYGPEVFAASHKLGMNCFGQTLFPISMVEPFSRNWKSLDSLGPAVAV